MKTSYLIRLFALLGILVFTIPEPAFAQKPEENFQKGLIKEEGEGELRGDQAGQCGQVDHQEDRQELHCGGFTTGPADYHSVWDFSHGRRSL